MLQVERAAIEQEARLESLGIVEKEVELVGTYMQNLGVMAALILGFSVNFFSPDYYQDAEATENEDKTTVVGVFFLISCGSIASLLFSIIGIMLVSTWGPNMAFRANSAASVRLAASQMRQDRMWINAAFGIGVLLFDVALMLSLWTKGILVGFGIASTAVLAVGVIVIVVFVYHCHRRYRQLPSTNVVKGDTFLAMAYAARQQPGNNDLQRDATQSSSGM